MRLFKRNDTWWIQDGKERFTTKCKLKREAEIFFSAYQERKRREAADPAAFAQQEQRENARLEDALLAVLDKAKQKGGAEATESYLTSKCKAILHAFGRDFLLRNVTAKSLDDYVALRLRDGVKPYTVHRELQVVRRALKLAKRHGNFEGDLDKLMPDLQASSARKTRVLSREECNKLIAAMGAGRDRGVSPERRAAFVAFTLSTGARLSEARRARVEDVDFEKGLVHLRGTKTEGAERKVSIIDEVIPWLKLAVEGQSGAMFEAIAKDFPLAKACKRAGLVHASCNDLRRTFATHLQTLGVRNELIAKELGHTSTVMVDTIYGRQSPESRRDQVLAQSRSQATTDRLSNPLYPATTEARQTVGQPTKTSAGEYGEAIAAKVSDQTYGQAVSESRNIVSILCATQKNTEKTKDRMDDFSPESNPLTSLNVAENKLSDDESCEEAAFLVDSESDSDELLVSVARHEGFEPSTFGSGGRLGTPKTPINSQKAPSGVLNLCYAQNDKLQRISDTSSDMPQQSVESRTNFDPLIESIAIAAKAGDFELVRRLSALAESLRAPNPTVVPIRRPKV